MARCILFDIDDTLFPSTEFSALARRNAINAMIGLGLGFDYAEVEGRLAAIIAKKGPNYPHHFDDLCAELGLRAPGRYVAAAVAAYHDTKASIAPFPKVPLTLLRLRQAGHRLFVATQGSTIKQWDKLIRLRIALFFEDVFVSEELGSDKGPDFYRRILERLGAAPADCVMVGDREDGDIAPAASVGMKTVRVHTARNASTPSRADRMIPEIGALPDALQDL
jgi:putative hydrolase of the HAD superfamily